MEVRCVAIVNDINCCLQNCSNDLFSPHTILIKHKTYGTRRYRDGDGTPLFDETEFRFSVFCHTEFLEKICIVRGTSTCETSTSTSTIF